MWVAVSRPGRSFSGGSFKAELEFFVWSLGWNEVTWAAVVSFQRGGIIWVAALRPG
jgi:hypothetical protein